MFSGVPRRLVSMAKPAPVWVWVWVWDTLLYSYIVLSAYLVGIGNNSYLYDILKETMRVAQVFCK